MQSPIIQVDPETGYFTNIEDIRVSQYPSLANTTYLDHAGTTLYAKSLIEAFSTDLTQNLYGNPHSASSSSQLSSRRIEDARLQILRFFNANPDDFDLVFVANATAAIKLVADAFRDNESGFWYGYHRDSHTSLVGVRELAAQGSRCFINDADVESWLLDLAQDSMNNTTELSLLAFPGQSNMTGRRLNFDWSRKVNCICDRSHRQVYTLFDAAALASTSPLDLSDPSAAPDFTVISFYKIFGFPDLGALLVRKASAEILRKRRYFGGGTVDSVDAVGTPWHEKKGSIHAALEDGTLPFHSIVALQSALETHSTLYGSMSRIARHTGFLASQLRADMSGMKHANGSPVCEIYYSQAEGGDDCDAAPVIAFNLLNNRGDYVSAAEVEKLAIVNSIQFRTGGLCNPGGIASHLQLSGEDLRQNYAAGHRCGGQNDLVNGRPTGTIRVSFGPMSSLKDEASFVSFLREYYIEGSPVAEDHPPTPDGLTQSMQNYFVVESLSVFPIKSCGAFKIIPGKSWEVGPKGLAWDREWCLVHEGTHVALSQKRYPQMALLYPSVDLQDNTLRITHDIHGTGVQQLRVRLSQQPLTSDGVKRRDLVMSRASQICGETVDVDHYTSTEVSRFFTNALGVPCTLARFPESGMIRWGQLRAPGAPAASVKDQALAKGRPISLSNESPVLLISRSSVNRLNEQIKQRGGAGKAVSADSFRGNIVVSEELQGGQQEIPYAEDEWKVVRIGEGTGATFEILGPCQRCQMVCVDQKDASRRQEPFSTLSKTRRQEGRVWFGVHMCLAGGEGGRMAKVCQIRVGDRVMASRTCATTS